MNNYALIVKSILMADDVEKSIRNRLDVLLKIMPEIKDMIGFEHNHPHHHLDVFEHTLLALSRAPQDFEIRLVLLLHDIGKPHSYQDEEVRHFRGHPLVSSEMARKILERLEFDGDEIEEMCMLIKEHDSYISEQEIRGNRYMAQKKFQIQYCDGLAHHPEKLEKRATYLMDLNKRLHTGEKLARYNSILSKFIKDKR